MLLHRLERKIHGSTVVAFFGYDGPGTSFVYNAESFMTSATTSPGAGSYVVDAQGRRVKKTVSGTITHYFYSGSEMISDLTGTAWTDYIFFGGQRIVKQTGSTLATATFLHTDHLGSVRRCTDSTGAQNGTCDYEPFGEGQSSAGCTVPSNFRFAGMLWDSESNLNHTWFRQYDSAQGRWMGADPIEGSSENPRTLNRYVYVLNDPVNFVDPLGLKCYEVTESADGDGKEKLTELPQYTTKSECEAHGGIWFDGSSITVNENDTPPGTTTITIIVITMTVDPRNRPSDNGDGDVGGGAAQIVGCLVKGAVAGAVGAAVVVGAATVAVTVGGASAAVVTGVLGVAGVVGGVVAGGNALVQAYRGNWTGVAYSGGSFLGGGIVGVPLGGRIANAIRPPASSGWSIPGNWAMRFRSSLGSVRQWLGTGPTKASAGMAAALSGAGAAVAAKGGC